MYLVQEWHLFLLLCRCYVSVAVLGKIVYAMGGYDGHHRQSTAERYNYKTNQWSLIASMNVQRSDASATMLNGELNNYFQTIVSITLLRGYRKLYLTNVKIVLIQSIGN